MNKQLAKIESARLEIQERGILSFYITVKYEEGGCQSVGGIALDEFHKPSDKRIGTAYGCELIRSLLIELEVNDFSEMENKIIWVHGEGEGFNFKPKGVSALKSNNNKSKPVIFDEILLEMKSVSEV